MGESDLADEGGQVAGLGEVLAVRGQVAVLQGAPLVAGGGGQLLLVRGVLVLRVEAVVPVRGLLRRGGEETVERGARGTPPPGLAVRSPLGPTTLTTFIGPNFGETLAFFDGIF